MERLFFLTECDPELNTGGAIIRRGTIENLRKKGIEIYVIKPGYKFAKVSDFIYTIPGFSRNKFYYAFEALGLVADKYFIWSNNVVRYMSSIIKEGDVIFATSGGALSTVVAGVELKKKTRAKLIVNYHDPTDFTSLGNGFSRDSRFFHINRDPFERRLISYMDYIITSSEAYKSVLINKYPNISNRIECNYFGYIRPSGLIKSEYEKVLSNINIVYGGNMGPTQSPEILAESVDGLKGITATFIGDYNTNKNLIKYQNNPNVVLVKSLSMDDYFQYLYKYADVGFFSLRNNLTNFCVPSKFYDYINLGLPMIAVAGGDAAMLIENKQYGCVSCDNIEVLRTKIANLRVGDALKSYQYNVLRDREEWSMDYRSKQIVDIISSKI